MDWSSTSMFSYASAFGDDPLSNFNKFLTDQTFSAEPISDDEIILKDLNESQRNAVIGKDNAVLFAGPGSGKTKTLLARVKYLLEIRKIEPEAVLAITFTNKAAKELKLKLNNPYVHVFTFHSLCAFWLKMNGTLVGVPKHFEIIDSSDSNVLFSLEATKIFCEKLEISIEETDKKKKPKLPSFKKECAYLKKVYDNHRIKGMEYKENYRVRYHDPKAAPIPGILEDGYLIVPGKDVKHIADMYDKSKVEKNYLDFDDLLIKGDQLFQADTSISALYKQVLVDEFQDTSLKQMEMLLNLTQIHKNLWVVGDLNQQIYTWRNANGNLNLELLRNNYPESASFSLDVNYRSTAKIWSFSKKLIEGSEHTVTHIKSFSDRVCAPVSLTILESSEQEASFISKAIQDLVSKGVRYGDIAIIVRFGAQTRVIEDSFLKCRLPYRVLSGLSFYERAEVKDVIAFMKLAGNPADYLSLKRIMNVPARSLGPAAVSLFDDSYNKKSPTDTAWSVFKELFSTKKPVVRFINAIDKLAENLKTPQLRLKEITDEFLKAIDYSSHLEKSKEYNEAKESNVLELLNILQEIDNRINIGARTGELEAPAPIYAMHQWLESISLDSSIETKRPQNKDAKLNKVSIISAHSAKGLEWPVVFVTNCHDGSFPSVYRSDETLGSEANDALRRSHDEEERRVFYVAATRAEGLLMFTASISPRTFGRSENAQISRFFKFLPSFEDAFAGYPFAKSNEGLDFLIDKCRHNTLVDDFGNDIPFLEVEQNSAPENELIDSSTNKIVILDEPEIKAKIEFKEEIKQEVTC